MPTATISLKRGLHKSLLTLVILLMITLIVSLLTGHFKLLFEQSNADLRLGEFAPEFSLSNEYNTMISLHSTQGKIRIISFWATWCAPCLKNMPEHNKLAQRYGERLSFFKINYRQNPSDYQAIIEQVKRQDNAQSLIFLFDHIGLIAQQYQVDVLPYSVVIDQKGIIVKVIKGSQTSKLQQSIKQLL